MKEFPSVVDPNEQYHLRKFLRKCYTFSKYNDDYLEVIRRCLCEGPSYAKFCKDSLTYGFIRRFSVDPDDEEVNAWRKINHFHDVFPERHLIFWTEDDAEDYKYSMDYVKTDDNLLKEYEEHLDFLIKDISIKPVRDFFLKSEGGATASASTERYRGYAKLRSRLIDFSDVMIGYRSLIAVGPANSRDAYVLEDSSTNTVSLISRLTSQIVNQLEASAMRTGQGVHTRLEKGSKKIEKGFYTYIRDFKKSGLTMPHKILDATIRRLVKRYPDFGFEYGTIFTNAKIRPSKEADASEQNLEINRGHGLGMCNEITTLIQCTIDSMTKQKLGTDHKIHTDCFNDDFRAIGSLGVLYRYQTIDREHLGRLGFVLSENKTAIIKGASVLLEEYDVCDKGLDWSKKILQDMALDDIFEATNIVHAKYLARPLFYNFWLNDMNEELEKFAAVVEYWGYEFYPEEAAYPSEMGGWADLQYMGRSVAMRDNFLEKGSVLKAMKAVKAENVKVTLPKLKGKRPEKFGLKDLQSVEISDDIRALCPHIDAITWNQREMADQIWSALTKRATPELFWQIMARDRRIEYRRKRKTYPSPEEIFNKIVKNNRSKTYILPKFFITEWESGGFEEHEANSYWPRELINNIDPMRGVDIEQKHFEACGDERAEKLSEDEEMELLFRSGLVEGYELGYCKTTDHECAPDMVKKYDIGHLFRNAAYLRKYNLLPKKISPFIKLIDRETAWKLPEIVKNVRKFDVIHPRTLSMSELRKVHEIASRLDVNYLSLYALIRAFELKITDSETQSIFINEDATVPFLAIELADPNDPEWNEREAERKRKKKRSATEAIHSLTDTLEEYEEESFEGDEGDSESDEAPADYEEEESVDYFDFIVDDLNMHINDEQTEPEEDGAENPNG